MNDKKTALSAMLLLSALESWAFSLGKPLPDHILTQIDALMDKLKDEVLR